MSFDRFLIAPVNVGLETDIKPWLIPDDAFAQLNNAYVFRGRVKKRFGSYLMNGSVDASVAQLYSRLRIKVGTTNGAGNLAGVVPGSIFKIGQLFSVGDEIFTVNVLGIPAVMLTTGAATVHTFNTNTGAFVINGAAAGTDVYFYPAEPVMGLITYETSTVNNEPVYAFDTQFAYQYIAGGWERLGTAVWTGNNAQFYWGATIRNINAALSSTPLLFVSNYKYADQIKYWDGAAWTNFHPNTADGSGNYTIESARIIVQFKNRLVFLNTIEKVNGVQTSFTNRCRFSWVGNVLDPTAFRTDLKGNGGLKGAPTAEAIISAEFLKDRLIVFFERSTWELVYTGNQISPFDWQKIDTALGAESTFATVPFDKVILGVGNVGVHACNGANVERVDQKIPESVFEIHNDNDGVQRVYGIRDYYSEMVYWTFPSTDNSVFPGRVLVYNYRNGSWAFNDDSITCFGYYQRQDTITWESTNKTWEEFTATWDSSQLHARALDIIAGTPSGFVFIVDTTETRNAPSMQITDYSGVTMTIIDHNLAAGDYIYIENLIGYGNSIFTVRTIVDSDTITVNYSMPVGTYVGGATAALVSVVEILTKQYNFFLSQGRNSQINKVNFLVDKTALGAMTVDYFISSSSESELQQGAATGSLVGTGTLETSPYAIYPIEATQERVWHPIYLDADGGAIQLRIYLGDAQATNVNIAFSDFQLNAMVFYARPSSMNIY